MYTFNAGVFSTWMTVGYYYIIVLAMIVLNILFSWRDGDMIHLSLRNGLGKLSIGIRHQLNVISRDRSEWPVKCINF